MTTATSDALLPNLDETRPALPDRSSIGRGQILLDHVRRVFIALAGFRVYRASWLRPWVTYCFSPLLNRVVGGRIAHFSDFNVRLGECDLYTFANVFEDYPVRDIERALNEVELIVDLGANVGAFSCLVAALCRRHALDRPIVAVEPNTANVEFLRQQPFARAISIRRAAVGAINRTARLVRGHNSVSDYVDFSQRATGQTIDVISLNSLCDRPALVKMDIEGGEWSILEHGLPENVRHLVLECHGRGEPSDLVAGDWRRISMNIHCASTWWLSR